MYVLYAWMLSSHGLNGWLDSTEAAYNLRNLLNYNTPPLQLAQFRTKLPSTTSAAITIPYCPCTKLNSTKITNKCQVSMGSGPTQRAPARLTLRHLHLGYAGSQVALLQSCQMFCVKYVTSNVCVCVYVCVCVSVCVCMYCMCVSHWEN